MPDLENLALIPKKIHTKIHKFMTSVAVVILNYNGRNFLASFLPFVTLFSENAQIYVADNHSTDDSIAFLKNNYSQIKIIELSQNYGFAGGYNESLKQIQADYFVLLNSDVEVTPNWIQPIIQLMENDKSIAACQPKIKSFHRKTHFEYAGAGGGMIDYLGYAFCRGRIFDSIEEDLGQYNDTREVFWASGAAMFVRAKVYQALGGLDADFFAHMEEIDLCWRMKNEGHKIYYCSDSTVFHVGGGTLHKSNPKKTFLNYRNNLAMMYKNLPANKLLSIIFIRLVLDGISGIKLFLSGSFADTYAIIKAHFAFYGWIKSLHKKRNKISQKPISEVYQNSIVKEYFLGKKKTFSTLKATKSSD